MDRVLLVHGLIKSVEPISQNGDEVATQLSGAGKER